MFRAVQHKAAHKRVSGSSIVMSISFGIETYADGCSIMPGYAMGIVRIFSRGREQMRVENRYDTQTAEFLLVIEHHDGYCETKRFAEALAFRAWLSAFEAQLERQQWMLSEPHHSRS